MKKGEKKAAQEVESFSKVYDMNGYLVECKVIVPFFLMESVPCKKQLKAGYKSEIYYASESKNKGLRKMKLDDIYYEDLTTIYINREAKEDARDAFRYLLNVQGVANKVIVQAKAMVGVKITKDQYDYIATQMRKLLIRCSEVLREQKKILESDGIEVNNYACSTDMESKNCQVIRIATAILKLKELGQL